MINTEIIFKMAKKAGNSEIRVNENVIIPFSLSTVKTIEKEVELTENKWLSPVYHPYCTCQVKDGKYHAMPFSIVKPMMGASTMAVIIEDLIIGGAKFIFLSAGAWALSGDIKTGDFMLPLGSLGVDGTTFSHGHDGSLLEVEASLVEKIEQKLEYYEKRYFKGYNATFEAFYNITPTIAEQFKSKGCVSMENGELNNLLFLGQKYKVKTCALFVSYLNLGQDEPWNPKTFESESYIKSTSLQGEIFLKTAFSFWKSKKTV